MAKLEAAAALAVVGVLAFIYLKVAPGLNVLSNTVSSFERQFSSSVQSVTNTVTNTIERINPITAFTQDQFTLYGSPEKVNAEVQKNPYGTSLFGMWNIDRNRQVMPQGQADSLAYKQFSAPVAQTAPLNFGMGQSINSNYIIDQIKGGFEFTAGRPNPVNLSKLPYNTNTALQSNYSSKDRFGIPAETPTRTSKDGFNFVNYRATDGSQYSIPSN